MLKVGRTLGKDVIFNFLYTNREKQKWASWVLEQKDFCAPLLLWLFAFLEQELVSFLLLKQGPVKDQVVNILGFVGQKFSVRAQNEP